MNGLRYLLTHDDLNKIHVQDSLGDIISNILAILPLTQELGFETDENH